MERLGQHLGVLGRRGVRVERDRGEAGDEHDLDVGVELGGPARQLDAVHLRESYTGRLRLGGALHLPKLVANLQPNYGVVEVRCVAI
jgi:hypothetical protein